MLFFNRLLHRNPTCCRFSTQPAIASQLNFAHPLLFPRLSHPNLTCYCLPTQPSTPTAVGFRPCSCFLTHRALATVQPDCPFISWRLCSYHPDWNSKSCNRIRLTHHRLCICRHGHLILLVFWKTGIEGSTKNMTDANDSIPEDIGLLFKVLCGFAIHIDALMNRPEICDVQITHPQPMENIVNPCKRFRARETQKGRTDCAEKRNIYRNCGNWLRSQTHSDHIDVY